MAILKLLFYHPYTIRVEVLTNSWTTPKSLAHATVLESSRESSCTEVAVTAIYVIL